MPGDPEQQQHEPERHEQPSHRVQRHAPALGHRGHGAQDAPRGQHPENGAHRHRGLPRDVIDEHPAQHEPGGATDAEAPGDHSDRHRNPRG